MPKFRISILSYIRHWHSWPKNFAIGSDLSLLSSIFPLSVSLHFGRWKMHDLMCPPQKFAHALADSNSGLDCCNTLNYNNREIQLKWLQKCSKQRLCRVVTRTSRNSPQLQLLWKHWTYFCKIRNSFLINMITYKHNIIFCQTTVRVLNNLLKAIHMQ